MTWYDLVQQVAWSRYFHGPLSCEEMENLLWEETAFPMAGELTVRRQLEAFFDFMASPEPKVIHAGRSRCPVCGKRWWVTPLDDCMLPACGCFGTDTGADNPDRPCQSCGLTHAWRCDAEELCAEVGLEVRP